MAAKHTKTAKKLHPKKYPQKRKVFSILTVKKLNKILTCQNRLKKNRKCNKFIPPGSPERQKHHIIPLSKGGTNNIRNILICCIDCHYDLHKIEFEQRCITLEQFRDRIYFYYENQKRKLDNYIHSCRKARVGVSSY